MITRKLGKIVRGGATPLQILMACVLGAVLGFIPGFWEAPGLLIGALLLLIILNANLFLAAMVGVGAKLLSLAAMPLQFQVGRLVLDGPTQGVMKAAINTPGVALLGLEYYATTGGLVLGIVVGAVVGLVLIKMLGGLWRRLAKIEEESEKYKAAMSKRWVRIGAWLFLGGQKKSFAEISKRKIGNPVRLLGVVFAALAVALGWIVYAFMGEQVTTALTQRALERANGATVDVGSARVDLKGGKMVITGLAMADPNALDTDLLRAARVEADIGGRDLLRKRIALDRIVVSEATQGEKRALPGRRIGKPPRPKPEPAGQKTIDDYIRDAQLWKERLAQAREWLEKVSGDEQATDEPAPGPDGKPATEPRQETLRERLARQVKELGYTKVRATHLIEGAPTVLVRELVAEGVRTQALGGDVVDIRAENLSTNPRLVPGSPKVTATTRSGKLRAAVDLGVAMTPAPGKLAFSMTGLDTNTAAGWLVPTDPPLVRDGTMDITLDGTIAPGGLGELDLPLQITLHNATVALPGGKPTAVARLDVPVAVRGALDNPAIVVDQKALADALVKAGADELAAKARGEAEKQIDKALEKATEKIGSDAVDKAKDALKGLIPGGK